MEGILIRRKFGGKSVVAEIRLFAQDSHDPGDMKKHSPVSILSGAALLLATQASLADSLIEKVTDFLQPRLQTVDPAPVGTSAWEEILARPDPGTFFLRYAFGIQRNASKVLKPKQVDELEQTIARHSPAHSRWHDERNTLRCKYNEVLWRYVGAGDAEAAVLRIELTEWMRLRMTWTEQEHLAQYRFARDVWKVLDESQRAKLLSGEWKAYAKQDTGHTRGDATNRIITRALGKPDDMEVFNRSAGLWSEARLPLQATVAEGENNERRLVFAMDLNNEAMVHEANRIATAAYSKLYLADADAIRRIVRSSYKDPKSKCDKAAAEAWREASERFEVGAPDLFRLLNKR